MPATLVETIVLLSDGMNLDSPKSATFACNFPSKQMLEVLTSLWIIGGLQPSCKYSNAAIPSSTAVSYLDEEKSMFRKKFHAC